MPSLIIRRLATLAMLGPLAACVANDQAQPGGLAYDNALTSEVSQQLAQAGSRSANALETLAMIQRARTEPRPSTLDETQLPDELRRKVTLEWSGPANELVKRLASNVGYSYIETGNAPATAGMVSMNIHDASAAKALEDVGLQVQRYATVVVDPNMRRIEYRNETAEGGRLQAPPATIRGPAIARRHVVTHQSPARRMGGSDGVMKPISVMSPSSSLPVTMTPVMPSAGQPVLPSATAPAASN